MHAASEDGTDAETAASLREPAQASPWYVLATLHGEQYSTNIDKSLHELNRRSWNRWVASALSNETKTHLAKVCGVNPDDLVALSHEEQASLATKLQQRLSTDAVSTAAFASPDATASIEFANREFNLAFAADGFIMLGEADFSGSRFRRQALFSGAVFIRGARFERARFEDRTWFARTIFSDRADFTGAKFLDEAIFYRSKFERSARFGRTSFKSTTIFNRACWKRSPDFRDATLPFCTTWHEVSWPRTPADKDNAALAVEHYAALRHAMDAAKRHDVEIEFFIRELSARARVRSWPERFAIRAYLLLSKGGLSFIRPFLMWVSALAGMIPITFGAITKRTPLIDAPTDLTNQDIAAAVEAGRLAIGSAVVVAAPFLDTRRLEQIESRLSEIGAFGVVPVWLQALSLLHAGFSGLCLFLMALALRNWLRVR